MSLAHAFAGHRRSILFLLAILALGGAATGLMLPVALFPQVSYPRIVVSLDAGDRPAEQMAAAVTTPVEQAVRAVPGVLDIRSTTSRGSADLSINFGWGADMETALLQVDAAVNQTLPALPASTRFTAHRMDPTVFPVAAYSLTSNSLSLTELRHIAQYQLLPVLSSIPGVARVGVIGGEIPEYRVDVDPARLAAYGLALDDVAKALSAANVLQAVGRVEDHYKLYLILSDTVLTTPAQIGHTVLRSGDNGIVELNQVATVTAGAEPQWLRVTADGHDAVSLPIYQQPGGNTVAIVKAVQAKLAAFRDKLPKDLKIAAWYDQGELITAAAISVRDAILLGIGLAALVLLGFLRSLKITLVAILAVPAVLAVTILLLYALDMSFNIMTLGGMAAAIGLIVDDAIVMVEHIIRRLRSDAAEAGAPGRTAETAAGAVETRGTAGYRERIRRAADEFTRPLVGSSAATIVVFLPLAFLSGVTGAFFKALSLTMASALAVSFLVAWLAVPLLSEKLLSQRDAEREAGGGPGGTAIRYYRTWLSGVLARPWLLILVLAPLLIAGFLAYRNVGSGFMPQMDEGGFILDYRTAPGTSLTETDHILRQIEGILKATPEVAAYSRRTGTQLGGGLTEANAGDFFVRLKPLPRRSIETIMDEVRHKVEQNVPGAEIEMAQLMQDLIGDLTSVPQPIEIKLFGDDAKALLATAPKVAAAIGKISGVVDVKDGIVLAGDALMITVDRNKAALEGVDPATVAQQIDAMVAGTVTTQVQSDNQLVGVRMELPRTETGSIEQIGALRLRAPDGHMFPVRRIARLTIASGQPQIVRDNLKRMVAVTGRISGRDLGSAVAAVQEVLAQPGLLPADVYFELGGLYRQQQIAFRGLIAVFVAAVALVFLVLLLLYERFRVALCIMAMPMLAASAVFIGLWLTGIELNISAMMGMTMVIGIVTEVAIFYFSEYQQLVAAGVPADQALVDAGVNRFRPIAMTTLAAILALLPLALALGQGAAMQQPLAIAIIAGLVVQMPLVLIVMPVLFRLLGGDLR